MRVTILASTLLAGVIAIGLSAPAKASAFTDQCKAIPPVPGTQAPAPDMDKACACAAGKIPAADLPAVTAVLKTMIEAVAKGGQPDASKLPPDQAKALETGMGAVISCLLPPEAPATAPAAPAPTAPAPAAPAAPAKVTGLAAWALLVGNSDQGKLNGEELTDYYLENGTVKTLVGDRLATGKWSLEGNHVCIVYPKEDKDCYTVEVAGDNVTWTDESGKGLRMQLLKGNPKHL